MARQCWLCYTKRHGLGRYWPSRHAIAAATSHQSTAWHMCALVSLQAVLGPQLQSTMLNQLNGHHTTCATTTHINADLPTRMTPRSLCGAEWAADTKHPTTPLQQYSFTCSIVRHAKIVEQGGVIVTVDTHSMYKNCQRGMQYSLQAKPAQKILHWCSHQHTHPTTANKTQRRVCLAVACTQLQTASFYRQTTAIKSGHNRHQTDIKVVADWPTAEDI